MKKQSQKQPKQEDNPTEKLVKVYRGDVTFDAPMRDVPNMIKNGWKRVGF